MARPIGELFTVVVDQAKAMMRFPTHLATLPTAAAKKAAIMEANFAGLISDEDAMLLIQCYQLETA